MEMSGEQMRNEESEWEKEWKRQSERKDSWDFRCVSLILSQVSKIAESERKKEKETILCICLLKILAPGVFDYSRDERDTHSFLFLFFVIVLQKATYVEGSALRFYRLQRRRKTRRKAKRRVPCNPEIPTAHSILTYECSYKAIYKLELIRQLTIFSFSFSRYAQSPNEYLLHLYAYNIRVRNTCFLQNIHKIL